MSLTKRQFEVQQEREAPAVRCQRVRRSLRSVRRDVEIYEGRLLDCATAEEMRRTLAAAVRELDALTLTLAVRERQVK
jgi:hypothetical protein